MLGVRACSVLGAVVVASALTACGGGMRGRVREAAEVADAAAARTHYEAVRANDGDDLELLGYVAEATLLEEAAHEERARRQAAVQQLALAGTRGRSALERLAARTGPASLDALVALARVGHRDARRVLRGLADAADPEVRVASVMGMDAEQDRALLVAWCTDPVAAVREAACARLGELAPDSDVLATLVERARVDPEAGVRVATTRALARFGEAALLSLRDRLADADARVRTQALEALLRADREQGRGAAASLLETPTSASTLEAARLLASRLDPHAPPSEADLTMARAHLFAALSHVEPALRGQAALALVAIETLDGSTDVALEALLASEPDVGVRLSLARALLPRRDEPARAALRRLLAEDHGMTGVQAAALLAGAGQSEGIDRLRADLAGHDVALRRVASRALARDALRPLEVREALGDDDVLVRVHAAGGILAAIAAQSR